MIEGYLAVPGSESHSILIETLTWPLVIGAGLDVKPRIIDESPVTQGDGEAKQQPQPDSHDGDDIDQMWRERDALVRELSSLVSRDHCQV